MKRFIILLLLIISCFLLQTTLFQALALANTVPNLLIILVVVVGYLTGKEVAMVVGLIVGFLVDCMYGDVIGLYSLLYMLVGYVNGLASQIYYKEDFIIPILFVAVSDFAFNFAYYVICFLLRNRTDVLYYLWRVVIPELVYTVLVAIFVYRLLHLAISKIDDHKMKEA